MRSRTEMVTTTLDGSDFDEESDFEDSEEDWRPEKGDPKALKRKTRDILTGTVGGKRGGGGRSNGNKKRGRGKSAAAKGRVAGGRKQRKSLDDDDDDSDEEDEDDDDCLDSDVSGCSTPPVPKRGRKSQTGKAGARGRKSGSSKSSPSTSKAVKTSPGSSVTGGGGLDSSGSELAVKPIQRKVVNVAGSFPDKSGYLKLFASRADLEEGIRDNLKVCLWRRDGSSLLQKYFRDKSVDASTPQFTSSMVYSCWEDKRADEYMEVKVRCIEQSKQLRVQIIDVEATECRAKEEYQKYIEKHGRPTEGSASDSERTANGNGAGSAASGGVRMEDNEEDDNDDNDDDGEEEDELEDDASQEE
uniref:Uncharacterized protein n=1 Tax=Anopheles dirus TaxID=7168 RepID=A0A182NTI5_9DIPT